MPDQVLKKSYSPKSSVFLAIHLNLGIMSPVRKL